MSFTLPDLPYPHDALEPHIDSRTMSTRVLPFAMHTKMSGWSRDKDEKLDAVIA